MQVCTSMCMTVQAGRRHQRKQAGTTSAPGKQAGATSALVAIDSSIRSRQCMSTVLNS